MPLLPDVHDTQTRSRNMAAIKAKNTKPEVIVRKGLHSRGFRYRLHDRALPGTPDIVLKRYRAIIDVRSCFFHGHDCSLFKLPETRREFWQKKIWANVGRDRRNLIEQRDLGWRTAIVWDVRFEVPAGWIFPIYSISLRGG